MFRHVRINTDSWKLQVSIKRMDSESSLSVQNLSSIYTSINDSTIHLTSYELSIFCQDETSY